MATPFVAIVGRPNVGKSTLFNRLVGERRAIVDAMPGLTRDRLYGQADWRGRSFVVVDTAGLVLGRLRDEEVGVRELRRRMEAQTQEAVVEGLPPEPDGRVEVAAARVDARVAVLGRPNVGKSSLVNALLGHERSLVDAVPGTTRDPVDTTFTFSGGDGQGNGRSVMLVDTAGIRRPGLTRGVEQYSLLRGLRAMERADVAVVVMDAREGVTAQDRHIAGYVVQAGRGLVLVVNKWDLLSPEEKDERVWRKRLKDAVDFAPWAPVAYVSVKTGQRADLPLSLALQVVASRARRVSTPELNRWLRTVLAEREPPSHKGKRLTVLYVNQVAAGSPTFLVFVNDPELVHFSYQRFLESRLRKAFGFEGT